MARSNMTELISHFRLFRGDLTSSVLTDGQVEMIFDLGKRYLDKVRLKRDSDGKVFIYSDRFVESDATVLQADGSSITPDESEHVNGIYRFNSSVDGSLYLQGFAHNLYRTVALAYRSVLGSEELWKKYRRGGVELTRQDVERMASAFEKMGFNRKAVMRARS